MWWECCSTFGNLFLFQTCLGIFEIRFGTISKDGYHTWPYMMIMYDNNIWASYMMIIYNDHTCSSYMIMIYVVSSSTDQIIQTSHLELICALFDFSTLFLWICWPFVEQNRLIFSFFDWHFNNASCTSELISERQILLQSSSLPFLRHLWKAAVACTIPGWMDMRLLWNFMGASTRKSFFLKCKTICMQFRTI